MTVAVGFFGKLPAHGDFVRRGLPSVVTSLLDDWLQTELSRSDDPAAMIDGLQPIRFASTAVAANQLALGTIVRSGDRVGRSYVLLGVRLSPHPSVTLPEPVPPAWDDWCGRAEALMVAARDGQWSADATQVALETSARATVAALTSTPFAVAENLTPATLVWRSSLTGEHTISRADGLPNGEAFDRFFLEAEVET